MLYQLRFFILPLLLFFTACSYNPLSTTNHLTGDPVETAAGGAAGFGTAAAFGAKSHVVLGLAGLGGASIGYYMSTVRYDAAGIYHAGGQVFAVGDYTTIEIPTHTLFDNNTSDLTPIGNAALRSAAKVLNRLCCQSILVSGNSSGFGTSRMERKMTEDRARVVAAFLWAQGVNNFKKISNDTRKLTYVGYGNYFVAQKISFVGVDDHIYVNKAGIPCIDIIEFNQANGGFGDYHHTHKDNMSIIDKTTLKAVGQTLLEVIYSEK